MQKTVGYCTFYIVRHGETDWNVKKIIQGQSDIPLNTQGEIQAKDIGEKLKHIHFNLAFSLDLLRTKRTAEIILLERKIAVQTTKVLRERYFGSYEGKSSDQLLADLDKLITENTSLKKEEWAKIKVSPDMESDEEVLQRLIPFLREVAVANANKNVLIASHGGIMRVLLIHLGFGTFETLTFRSIKNTAYIKLESDGVDFFIKETDGVKKTEL